MMVLAISGCEFAGASGIDSWVLEIEKQSAIAACKYDIDGDYFAIFKTEENIVTAEKVFVTDSIEPPRKFSVGWKLESVGGKQLALSHPSKTLLHAVVNGEKGYYAEHHTSYTPYQNYRGAIRVIVKFKTSDSSHKEEVDFKNLPEVASCKLDWP